MSDTDTGVPWSYDDSQVDVGQTSDIKAASPLQFAALYAESQPSDGKVALNKLGKIVSRARIPNEKSAVILEYAADAGTQFVSELSFYWALAQVSLVQTSPEHEIVYEPSVSDGSRISEVILYDTVESAENPAADDTGEWDVPDYNPTADESIRVTLMTKNAGSFFTKHAVYSIDGHFNGKTVKVLRRYRDFVLLHSLLSDWYTFRAIPVLPPKRLAMNGRYFVSDSQDAFINRRAAGLTRFLNLLVQHPILSKDSVVDTFLFADMQFDPHATVVKAHKDELSGKLASPLFISQWNAEKLKEWESIETAAHEFMNQVTSLCMVMERQIKRVESEQVDSETVGRSFIALSRFLYPLYPTNQEDLGGIQQRLESVAKYTDARHEQLINELDRINRGPLLQLKIYRDMMSSIIEIFSRLKSHGGNTIPEQQKQIARAQRKLVALSTKEDVKEEDLHKLRMKIQQGQASIRNQTNRGWLIKMVVNQELQMVQTMQYQLSKVLRDFAAYLSNSSTQHAELAMQLADSASSAPLKI